MQVSLQDWSRRMKLGKGPSIWWQRVCQVAWGILVSRGDGSRAAGCQKESTRGCTFENFGRERK